MKYFFGLFLLLISACNTHVLLQAPPPKDAPFEQRLKAYKELRPVNTTTHLYDSPYIETTMLLGNGKLVSHAVDLMPVVGENPIFANYVEQAKYKETTANWLLFSGAAAAIVGLLMFSSGVRDLGSSISGPAWAGLGISLGGFGLELAGLFTARSGHKDQQAAFSLYDSLLQKRMGVDNSQEVKDAK